MSFSDWFNGASDTNSIQVSDLDQNLSSFDRVANSNSMTVREFIDHAKESNPYIADQGFGNTHLGRVFGNDITFGNAVVEGIYTNDSGLLVYNAESPESVKILAET